MTNNQKYSLFLDAVRIIRSLADVFEAIADTYRDATVVEADAKINACRSPVFYNGSTDKGFL